MPIPALHRTRKRARTAATLILTVVAVGILAAWQSRAGWSQTLDAQLTWKTTARERAIVNFFANRSTPALEALREAGATPNLQPISALSGSFSWSFIGPEPMNLFGVPTTGRVTAIAADPATSGRLFVGTADGGVWLSSDNGTTFKPIFDSQSNLSIGAIALDAVHTSPPTIYVATGEGNGMLSSTFGAVSNRPEFLGAMLYGAGIYKSTNLGATWTSLGAATFGRVTFSRLAIDTRHNPPTVYAATGGGVSAGRAIRCFPKATFTVSGCGAPATAVSPGSICRSRITTPATAVPVAGRAPLSPVRPRTSRSTRPIRRTFTTASSSKASTFPAMAATRSHLPASPTTLPTAPFPTRSTTRSTASASRSGPRCQGRPKNAPGRPRHAVPCTRWSGRGITSGISAFLCPSTAARPGPQ